MEGFELGFGGTIGREIAEVAGGGFELDGGLASDKGDKQEKTEEAEEENGEFHTGRHLWFGLGASSPAASKGEEEQEEEEKREGDGRLGITATASGRLIAF